FNAICTGDHFQIPFWWDRLLQDEQYVEAYVNRWNELRNGILKSSNLLAYIDSVANELNESQIRNYNKWPILGTYVWPNAYVGNTYSDEVNYLKGWIESRTSWLDENINKLSGITSVEDNAGLNNKINLYPNPVEKELYIKYFLEKDETYLIELFDTFGKQLLLSKLEAKSGKQVMTINLQELTKQKLNFGLYFLQLTDENHKKHSFKIILN
ncbi:MAG: CotH kinase family protein, partial [Bacteroidota bacterium]|nr:CotH kinase family protein [Bacteroidota bacterium]